MPLPDVKITRLNGQLGRVNPTIDNVFAFVLSGAMTDSMPLGEAKLLTGPESLETLEITDTTNPLAHGIISRFYAIAGAGTEAYVVLYNNAMMLEDVCNKDTGLVKEVLDAADGRCRGLFVAKAFAEDYTRVMDQGMDADVIEAISHLQALCEARADDNNPIFAVIPGYGFALDNVATLADLKQRTDNMVHVLLGADTADGDAAIGTIAGVLAAGPVNQNIARVANGSVLNNAWLLDGTPAKEARDYYEILHDKRYIFFRKIFGKSGFFFNDDPAACAPSDDYSSISWNRIINKAHVLAYGVLIEKLNDDVDINPDTGKIEPSVAGNWESDVESTIQLQMVNTRQISAVKCTVDPESDIVNDNINATLQIVRNGQAKNIAVNIGYTPSL